MTMSDERILLLNPQNDGVTHINIYSRGQTRLGRLLTNLADKPVVHPTYGRFRTAEGLWYYLRTGMTCEDLRSMSGFEAKIKGRELPIVWHDNFKEEFQIACRSKLDNDPELMKVFVESTLPFEHYYFYESKKTSAAGDTVEALKARYKIIEPKDGRWLTEFWMALRIELQAVVA